MIMIGKTKPSSPLVSDVNAITNQSSNVHQPGALSSLRRKIHKAARTPAIVSTSVDALRAKKTKLNDVARMTPAQVTVASSYSLRAISIAKATDVNPLSADGTRALVSSTPPVK